MQKITCWMLSLAMIVVVSSLALAEKPSARKPKLKGIKCPVSGEQVTSCSVAYHDAKVYFCCPKCAKKFEQDSKPFVAKANHQLYATGQAKLVACIYCNKKPNPDTTIEIAGTKVCFGCEGCKQQVLNSKDQIAEVFGAEPFAKGFKVVTAGSKKKK